MIGASKDTVASWETGRNNLSATFARRIACATGVDGNLLLSGSGALITGSVFDQPKAFTAEDFKRYRETAWGRSDEEAARQHLAHCVDALELIFLAAASGENPKSEGRNPKEIRNPKSELGEAEKIRCRLPGVLDSFMQWCEGTREDFQLGPQIDEALKQRTFKMGVTMTYGEWRRMYRGDPAALKAAGFKDNPRKKDSEELRLEMEAAPGWAPGRSMTAPRPAVKVAVKAAAKAK